MAKNPEKFVDLLVAALLTIKAQSGRSMAAIQDELGYVLGREGSSYIAYLRKGRPPTIREDIEQLAHALIDQGGLDQERCEAFLQSAGHPQARAQAQHWFADNGGDGGRTMNNFLRTAPVTSQQDGWKPFTVGPPILQPRHFFGRQREIKRIFAMWNRLPLEHVSIIGPRRSGKSSLLHYLRQITQVDRHELRPNQRQDWLSYPEQYCWVLVDFQDVRMRQREALLRHLLAAFVDSVPASCTLESFMEVLADCDWQSAQQKQTVILFDELEAGVNAPELDQEFWWSLRALANTVCQGKLAFCVASHLAPMQVAEERGKSSPFFNMFNTFHLGQWSESETRELIDTSPHPFAEADVAWILETSDCWPVLAQICCQERLLALEDEDGSNDWQTEALRRCALLRELMS